MIETGSLPNLNQVLADAEAGLLQLMPKPPLNFGFQWSGVRFHGSVVADGGDLVLRIAGDLGVLPYTAEHKPKRERFLALVQQRGTDAHCHFEIGSDRRLRLVGASVIAQPLQPAHIVAGITVLLLRAQPHLKLARDLSMGGA
ncbi:MAG TPA: hypothetical protein VEU47_10850 [Candidatus Cybelea sp.]|nr:hypothetical protein [Candidatus Cybelea sp.]